MTIIFPNHRADGFQIRQGGSNVRNPLTETLGISALQFSHDPRKVRAVGFEPNSLARWTSKANLQAVQDKLLNTVRQKLLEPTANRKVRFVFRQISKR